MRSVISLVLPVMVLGVFAGCSSGRLSSAEQMNSQQQQYIRELVESADRNTTQIQEMQATVDNLTRRVGDIESRVGTTEANQAATLREVQETVAFLSDQLSRVDKSIETQRPRTLPQGADAFRPGGFDVQTAYDAALAEYQAKRYEEAIGGFKEVLTVAPTSSLADNSQYWMGECYDAMGQSDQAIAAFTGVFDFPNSNKYADAQLKIGIIYARTGRSEAAAEEFRSVIANFPDTDAARIARSQLGASGN